MDLLARLLERIRHNPVVTLTGPRQCGKTTLARQIASQSVGSYFDLENPADYERLARPMTALSPLRGLIVIDEAHLRPEIFPVLRVLADRSPWPARFLLLGSASPDLLRDVSESLAGRTALESMSGFNLHEVGQDSLRRLWWRGGLPRSFLAENDQLSRLWRGDFIQTFLERDVRRFGILVPPLTLRRLWTMLAHYHGQLWNGSEIGRSLGEAHTTVRRHLDILAGALMIRILPPWFENVSKRQVKSPKVYIRDSGLLHELLGISSFEALEGNPKLGASWEGFVLEEILRQTGDRDAYFWATQAGAELDLLLFRGGRRIGIEVKYADAPRITASMRAALASLKLDRLLIVYPGNQAYPMDEQVEVIPLALAKNRLAEA